MATETTFIQFVEGVAPSTPAAGKVRIYAKADGSLYQIDDAGAETGLAAGVTFSGARVHNSATQAIPTATWTSITFNSERFDTDAFHSTVTNTSRLTIPTTGYYALGANLALAASGSGTGRFCRFLLNGTTRIGGEIGAGYTPVAGNVIRINPHTVYAFTATDYVEVQLFQDSGGNLNSDVTANSTPEFWAYRVG